HGRGAGAFLGVAGEADAFEYLLAGSDVGLGTFRQLAAGQFSQHVGSNVAHAFLADGGRLGRHLAVAATDDGLLDVFRRTTPAPLVVGQVGEAVGALGIGTVAHGAVGGEQTATHFQ